MRDDQAGFREKKTGSHDVTSLSRLRCLGAQVPACWSVASPSSRVNHRPPQCKSGRTCLCRVCSLVLISTDGKESQSTMCQPAVLGADKWH